jgi:heat-inducible transcriptional repressor
MSVAQLSERERKVLEAVIRCYIRNAEPAGSRTLARYFGLGVSPATIRNTMSDLEDKGLLFHPHTSAGRIPTDQGYRAYVDELMPVHPLAEQEKIALAEKISEGGTAIESILHRAAQSLGVLAQELGVALGPTMDRAVLERLELARVSTERLLLVLTLSGGVMRTVFVEVRGEISEEVLAAVVLVLNERLAGLSLEEVRKSLASRLRETSAPPDARDLLNIFIQEGDQLFDLPPVVGGKDVLLGRASLLADQPEFASGEGMRELIALTETREQLSEFLRRRHDASGISITIGNEHADPRLDRFTIVTSGYRAGSLSGVIGVIGPTRMPYEKVIALVQHTSRLVSDLLE